MPFNLFKKKVNLRLRPSDSRLLDDLVTINKELLDDQIQGAVIIDKGRALQTIRDIRATLSSMYGIEDDAIQQAVAVEAGFHMETIRASAGRMSKAQGAMWEGKFVDSTILAAQKLAESTIQLEGDVYAALVSPIELGMNSRVWVSGPDKGAVEEINGLLRAWKVMDTINYAWQDMETYSAFYISHYWKNGVPSPVHWSPKWVWVGPDAQYGPHDQFMFLGDRAQQQMEFAETAHGTGWNEWAQSLVGRPLVDNFTWVHFLKPRHKRYPYPWLAKAATPVYTRQIIEEMRLALVQGVINQLWVMTVENPLAGEVAKLKSIVAANRAERVGFLLWRAGLKVDVYGPQAIEQLLLPEAWWSATLDIFRRMGRTIRIVSGENAQRSGQGSGDAEIDVRIAQNKAMAHRFATAEPIVLDLLDQWSKQPGTKSQAIQKMLAQGQINVHLSPIELFLGEALKEIWGPMWDRSIASVRTIHEGTGLDTDEETRRLEEEQAQGFDDIYKARQQFAQRVATPGGEVTRSPEPGRPEGQQAKAAIEDTQQHLLDRFDEINNSEDPEETRRKVAAFIILLSTLLRAHMREAYAMGYASVGGAGSPSAQGIQASIDWEQQYIDKLEVDLLAVVGAGVDIGQRFRYRIIQHVQASWRRAFMDGVFQAKEEDGWGYWQRVLRPWASKAGPCDICKEDAKRWHPLSEPFWDHPYGVCSAQVVRFMRSSADGWESYDRREVAVPLMDWEAD